MYTILYIQHTHFFKECTRFCIFNIHNFFYLWTFSKNVHNFIYSIYKIFQRMYTIFYIQHTQISKMVIMVYNSVYLTYMIFKKVYKILYIQCMEIFKKCKQFLTFNEHNFLKSTQFCRLKELNFFKECIQLCTLLFSKNLLNYVYSMYTFFSKKVYNSIYSMYINFQKMNPILYIQGTKFCLFTVYNFS